MSASTARIVGIDVARGLAVLGMFTAHVAATRPFDWGDVATWSGVVDGRSSILFALLAGISLALITGAEHPVAGRALVLARVRIAVRALALFGLGMLLLLPETNVAVILHYYAVFFVLALPLLRVPAAVLLPLAFALAVLMPFVLHAADASLATATDIPIALGLPLELLVTGAYPALLWIAFVLAGLGIGRLRLGSPRVQWTLLGSGIALAVAGYGSSAALGGSGLASLEPHSGTAPEAVGSGGFAIAVVGLCLLLSRVRRPLFVPVAAVGSMPLTAYVGQLLAIAVFRVPVPGEPGSLVWLGFALTALVVCTVWALLLGRGPLERALTWLSLAAVDRTGRPRLDDRTMTGERHGD